LTALVTGIKPQSVHHDYPHNVAISLNNTILSPMFIEFNPEEGKV